MKAAMAVLSILGAAAVIFSAVAIASSDSTTISGSVRPITGALNIDTRSSETKMAELQRGPVSHSDSSEDEGDMIVNTGNVRALPEGSSLERSKIINLLSNNSSAQNSSIFNSTALNSTALNSTALNTSASSVNGSGPRSTGASASGAGSLSGSTEAGSEGVSTSSSASVKGFYGVTASRHEMGKSDIKSRMFLSGNFDVDKTVQFQDQGF